MYRDFLTKKDRLKTTKNTTKFFCRVFKYLKTTNNFKLIV